MHFQQDNFPEPQSFRPEYMPEVVGPSFIDKEMMASYTKQGWFKRFLSLPKLSTFVLESLGRSNEFSSDLFSSHKRLESRVDRLNDKFAALEGIQGDFKAVLSKLHQVDKNESELQALKLQLHRLSAKSKVMTALLILMLMVNTGLVVYVLQKRIF
jgi:hypothetical protein